MEIRYSPVRSDSIIEYEFDGDTIVAKLNGESDVFDFSGVPDGEIKNVETTLSVNPIISAKRANGILRVELLYYHGQEATEEELFPEWQVVIE